MPYNTPVDAAFVALHLPVHAFCNAVLGIDVVCKNDEITIS